MAPSPSEYLRVNEINHLAVLAALQQRFVPQRSWLRKASLQLSIGFEVMLKVRSLKIAWQMDDFFLIFGPLSNELHFRRKCLKVAKVFPLTLSGPPSVI